MQAALSSVANDFALHLVEARYKLGHTFTLDDSKCIYFIKEGTVCICARIELPAAERKDKPKFETIDLARLEKGAFFAESCVPQPHTSSGCAPTLISDFDVICGASSAVFVARCLLRTLRIRSNPLSVGNVIS